MSAPTTSMTPVPTTNGYAAGLSHPEKAPEDLICAPIVCRFVKCPMPELRKKIANRTRPTRIKPSMSGSLHSSTRPPWSRPHLCVLLSPALEPPSATAYGRRNAVRSSSTTGRPVPPVRRGRDRARSRRTLHLCSGRRNPGALLGHRQGAVQDVHGPVDLVAIDRQGRDQLEPVVE